MSSGVHIPASFTIRAGGTVVPTVISVPPRVTIALHIRNVDTGNHVFRIEAQHMDPIAAPPGNTVSTDIVGLGKGTYEMLVDGHPRARIVVGAVPGP